MSEQRRSSFGMLLRRSKSGELGKGGKRAQSLRDAEIQRQRQAASRIPPKLPEFASHSERLSKSFDPELRPESSSSLSPKFDHPSRHAKHSVPVPPIPSHFDPYARTESMTNRGRYSYASSAVSTLNSPRRVRRRKDPTPFNILIVGTRGSGKTSFLEFLKTALALPPKKRSKRSEEDEFRMPPPASGNFIPHYLESEIDGERVGLTLWDSEGLEKNMVDLQLREMSAFLESKFEETFAEEMKVIRSPGVQDTHIHAVFLVLDPSRLDRNIAAARSMTNGHHTNGYHMHQPRVSGSLDEDLDLQVLRTLEGKTTVIPVIAKADTITTKHMNVLKKTVWESIKKANLDPLEALGLDEDDVDNDRIDEETEEDLENGQGVKHRDRTPEGEDWPIPRQATSSPPASPSSKRLSSQSIRRHKAQEEAKEDDTPFLPMSIISPDLYEPNVIGRQFPWGFADPYNEEHCDFQRLKDAVFSEWRAELREASREQWYEGWRTTRLKHRDLAYRPR
ncbi:hypothetical protein S40285_07748 [Stachybotrys chlorohalonatus IBT 40285]|uniref:Septin-type G domain-containing protein n=1 Tax=Stachybotrys chlorohalonatus (strain IBT 40285) TaxID=1283841 RepID=A0A084QA11_STAC4|nr:hypothetical protein S40285_07748 [Stachybotrys chlorohalonata IBT 40285]